MKNVEAPRPDRKINLRVKRFKFALLFISNDMLLKSEYTHNPFISYMHSM